MASRPSLAESFFAPLPLFTSACLLRAVLLVYGLWQDANSPLKYTDIDYLVFTDAARFTFPSASISALSSVSAQVSPYARETYRYTPLLAWLLYPTTWPGLFWFSSGKIIFAVSDLAAGWLIARVLQRHRGMKQTQAFKYASIWLLNPMVATISTRGSSEGLLGVLVTAILYLVLERRVTTAGFVLGLAVHFKIYPFIYAPAIVWWMDAERMGNQGSRPNSSSSNISLTAKFLRFVTPDRIRLTLSSLVAFGGLNALMFASYGHDFVRHTFLHHVTRIDHRHNFSPYNVLLYLNSAGGGNSDVHFESVAFVPQILLSTILIPLVGAKKDLPATMLAQTFAFVTFNKVCTSQYFLWYLVLLPLCLHDSSFLRKPVRGIAVLGLWIAAQALWLQQGYELEFLGRSTFVPGLWLASLVFFLVNCWILGQIIGDLAESGTQSMRGSKKA